MPKGVYPRKTLAERLFSKVRVTESCWLWQGRPTQSGHGQIATGQNDGFSKSPHRSSVHRVSYELHVGPIPDGMCVCHSCDVPNCVNPLHLFLGTKADNNRDMVFKGRQTAGERHYKATLTSDQVREIRRSPATHAELALRFGVARATITGIKLRRSWASLPD